MRERTNELVIVIAFLVLLSATTSEAVMDYFSGIITSQEAIKVVMAYFSG